MIQVKNRRSLVLNSSYMPLSVFPLYTIPAEDAITRYLTESCDVVVWYDDEILTVRDLHLKWPSVIANRNGHGFRKDVRLKKESLFYRDHCVCQYCGDPVTLGTMTYDHVLPRAHGGKHSWENTCVACRSCNNEKGDSLSPRWKPRNKPWKPDFYQLLDIRSKYPIVVDDPSWSQFLPNWAGEIIVRGDVPMGLRRDELESVDDLEEV